MFIQGTYYKKPSSSVDKILYINVNNYQNFSKLIMNKIKS